MRSCGKTLGVFPKPQGSMPVITYLAATYLPVGLLINPVAAAHMC